MSEAIQTVLDRALRVGLVADAGRCESLAHAIESCPEFSLACYWTPTEQVVFPGSATRMTHPADVLVEGGVDAIVLDCETRRAATLAVEAMGRGVHCYLQPPLGRSFSEAVGVCKAAKSSPARLMVRSRWEQIRDDVRQMMTQAADFAVVCSELEVATNGPDATDWRYGKNETGGGVLLQDGYELLETMIGIRRLPDAVYAAVNRQRRPANSPAREIEDFADVSMRYEDDGTAHLRASWLLKEQQKAAAHHSSTHTVTITADRLALRDLDGATVADEKLPAEDDEAEMLRFAAAIVKDHDAARRLRVVERHLAVSALIDSAYLSARTCHAESPRKLYSIEGWPEPRE